MKKGKGIPKQRAVGGRVTVSNLKRKTKVAVEMYTLEEMVTRHIGRRGNPRREEFEFEWKMAVFGGLIRSARLQRKLTQTQLGALVGVKKAHISKIENGAHNARVDTLVKVFKALDADVRIQVTLNEKRLKDE